jgi:transposase
MLASMSDGISSITIPNDLAACQALVEQLVQTVDSQSATIVQLQQVQEELKLTITELLQRAFARRSERYLLDPHQLQIDFGDTLDAADAASGLAEAVAESGQRVKEHVRRKKRGPRSEELPAHLPRYEVEAEAPEQVKHCPEHGERKLIGYDATETLEFERPKLRVRVSKYPKYACENQPQCGVASPDRPTGLVEGNRYDTSIAAEILTNKYGYHLPVYRQQDQFAGSGWAPSRSTLLNILEASAFAIRPLAEHLRNVVLASDIVGTDDTHVTLLLPENIPQPEAHDLKSGRAYEVLCEAQKQGRPSVMARMWAYRSVTVPLVFFDFTASRHRDGPDLVLESFRGKLMADCYSVYQGIALRSDGQIERGACVAHARRKVFEARESYPLEASLVLAQFQQLYDIETRAKSCSCDERLRLRLHEARAVWESLGEWLGSRTASDILPKSKFGQALTYLRNHWEPLQLYLTDGRMPIDNNDVEQLMKQIALGRKNWIFIGSLAAGERAADFFTLVASAVRNHLDVWAYVKDVLDRLLAGETDYDELRPDVWATAHPEAIRQYRVEERRDKADRKQTRRAARRLISQAPTA